ncbi:MAG TPA: hypothetical protein IAB70_05495 [Candidatus Merdicola faecigallinarum]|uniref:Uncharacterized protein n=1 Tax=Candidatus Merdicola faecigallinarum TaxID=2840862 RepID=A0A9D1M1Q1_9FIRM|nr:hypothetical protein [Candidatus Merdicola faecigallinarum]
MLSFEEKHRIFLTNIHHGNIGRLYPIEDLDSAKRAYRSVSIDIMRNNSKPYSDGSPGEGRDL